MRFIGFFKLVMQPLSTFGQGLYTNQWKNRVPFLKDIDLNSDWLSAQQKRLKSNQKELDDRGLSLFLWNENAVYDA